MGVLFLITYALNIVKITSSVEILCSCVCTDLEVYVLNTEADIQDLRFPHSYDSDSILQISALALQQYSNNGLCHTPKQINNLYFTY